MIDMTPPQDSLRIEAPENVSFAIAVAGLGSRFLAATIDFVIILGLQIIVNLMVLFGLDLTLDGSFSGGGVWVLALVALISFFIFWGYYLLFEITWSGQTPGKRKVGLRVVGSGGAAASVSQIFIRNLIRLVDFIPANYAVGVVTMFIDPQSRRLGDLAAGTLVVLDEAPVPLSDLIGSGASPAAGAPDPAIRKLPLERLTRDDVQIIEDFLARRHELHNREAMAEHLLANAIKKMGGSRSLESFEDPERTLEDILRAARRGR